MCPAWIFPGRFFVAPMGRKEARCPRPNVSTAPKPAWFMRARLRSQFAETSEALFLTQGYVYDSAEQCEAAFLRQGAGLRLFALLEPDRVDVRAAHGRARRRGSGARHRDRNGGGHHRADGSGAGRRSCRCGQGAVRRLPLGGGGMAAAVRRRNRRWSTAPISTSGRRRCARTPKPASWKRRPIRRCEVIDIAEVAKIAHSVGAKLIVDNVFATPLYQSPLELGADCVVYSATKHIDGQGRCLGGVILGSEKFIQDHVHQIIRQTGPSLSPFNAWVMLKGLETLAVRVARQTETAAKIADELAGHPKLRAADLSRPRRPSAGRHHQEADEGRLNAGRVRGRKAARPARSASRMRSS